MTGEDNTRFSPFKEFNTSVSDWFTNFSLVEFEESVAGKSGAGFLDETRTKLLVTLLQLDCGNFGLFGLVYLASRNCSQAMVYLLCFKLRQQI